MRSSLLLLMLAAVLSPGLAVLTAILPGMAFDSETRHGPDHAASQATGQADDQAAGQTTGQTTGEVDAQASTGPVLVVAGEELALRAYEDWLLRNFGESEALSHARLQVLREQAQKRGLAPGREAIEAQVEAEFRTRLEGAYGGDAERWRAELASEGRSYRGRVLERALTLEVELLYGLLVEANEDGAARAAADEAALRTLWQERYGPEGRRPRVRLLRRRFVVPFQPGENTETRRTRTEALRAEARAGMEALRARALAGEDFEALVRAESDHPSKAQGGLPENTDWQRGFPTDVFDALVEGERGALSPPVFAGGAFWLLRREGVDVTPLESVREALAAELARRPRAGEPAAELESRLTGLAIEPTPLLLAPEGSGDDAVLFHIRSGGVARPVRRAEFARRLRILRGEREATRFALEHHLRATAAAAGITLDTEALEVGIQRARATDVELTAGGDRAAWAQALAARGLDEAAWRRAALRRIELEALEDALARQDREPPGEAQLRQAWEAWYGPGGVREALRWIQLRVPPVPPEVPDDQREAAAARVAAEVLARAEALRARAAGGAAFAELAREHSDDPATAARGGAPEEDFDPSSLPRDLRAAVVRLEPGQTAAPVLLEAGDAVVLLHLEARQQVPFEDARQAVERRLLDAPATLPERAALRAALTRASSPRLERAVLFAGLGSSASNPTDGH